MTFICLLMLLSTQVQAQKPLYEQMALTTMDKLFKNETFVNESKGPKWTYDMGVVLEGMIEVWRKTGNAQYFDYVQGWMDQYVDDEGHIRNYKRDEFNIDHVKNGKVLLTLYKVTEQEKYLKACHLLFGQMEEHPRTNQGGFWHKKIYPYQMWLDGLYMAQPFLTEYADLMDKPELFDDIVNQFVYMEQNARDKKTGLLYHGWDESREQRWADPKTGLSPHFWARGMGWYVMGLVDVLDYFPINHPRRKELLAILDRTMTSVVNYQDPISGVWYDIVDLGHRKGNYLEASASSMFVYGLAKSIRKGYISKKHTKALEKAYAGLIKEFVSDAGNDRIDLHKVVAVSGLGGEKNYRDGSFEYYMSEPVVTNDYKGVGPFMMADSEMETFENRGISQKTNSKSQRADTDPIAERVLVYQLPNGGWPKQLNDKSVVDYNKKINTSLKSIIDATTDKFATIDNKATSREIYILMEAYAKTGNNTYLQAAEHGVRYLLKAQYPNGGFPQYYPDTSNYRAQITYNDNAMVNALEVLHAVAEEEEGFGDVRTDLKRKAQVSVARGIDCILKTQIRQADSLTIWAAQYDENTLIPSKARPYEPAALSTSESVQIVRFLMKQEPTEAIKKTIHAAVHWFESHDIEGYRFDTGTDPNTGKMTRELIKDPEVNTWARFYDLESNRPIFGDRDNSVTYDFAAISEERQHGYAWYGVWPQKLIDGDYPKWIKRIEKLEENNKQ